MDNNEFKKEIELAQKLTSDRKLFDNEFEKLKTYYHIEDDDVYDFILNSPKLIPVLKKLGPIFKKELPQTKVYLEVDYDFTVGNKLFVKAMVDKEEYANGFWRELMNVSRQARPLARKLQALNYFVGPRPIM